MVLWTKLCGHGDQIVWSWGPDCPDTILYDNLVSMIMTAHDRQNVYTTRRRVCWLPHSHATPVRQEC